MNGTNTTNNSNLIINFIVSLQHVAGKIGVLNFDFGFWNRKKTEVINAKTSTNNNFPNSNKKIPNKDWHSDSYLSKNIPKTLPNGEITEIEKNASWEYINDENTFLCKFYIINKCILFSHCAGNMDEKSLEKLTAAKKNVIAHLNKEKFFCILDIREMGNVEQALRVKMEENEIFFQKYYIHSF